MAPVAITEDYYCVLGVEQSATLEIVVKAYKRLALKLHPDRNPKPDATAAFQLLGRAYETLKDESKRKAYDITYPSISRNRSAPQTTQTTRPTPSPTPQSEALIEKAQIATLQKSKQERHTTWGLKKVILYASVFELQRQVRRLEQEIKILDVIAAAEAAEEARKNSWGTWLLSPIYKRRVESEEEKAAKNRARQERGIEKDMKERRLNLKQADLKKDEGLLRKGQEEVDAADLVDDRKIRVIQQRTWARETREREEAARVENERREKIRKKEEEEWWERQREAAEALRVQRMKEQAVWQKQREVAEALKKRQMQEQKQQAEQARTRQEQRRQAEKPNCIHDGWWPKIQGRTPCPKCYEVWTYLLQCPSCETQACPKCQSAIRPKKPRNTARTNQRAPPRARTPSPVSYYDDAW